MTCVCVCVCVCVCGWVVATLMLRVGAWDCTRQQGMCKTICDVSHTYDQAHSTEQGLQHTVSG